MSAPTQLDRIEAMLNRVIDLCAPSAPADDEKIFKDPPAKYWQGGQCAGLRMSECSADYLMALSKYKRACAFMGRKENNPEKLKYVERDEATAALAIQWADYQRKTGKKIVEPELPGIETGEVDSVPF